MSTWALRKAASVGASCWPNIIKLRPLRFLASPLGCYCANVKEVLVFGNQELALIFQDRWVVDKGICSTDEGSHKHGNSCCCFIEKKTYLLDLSWQQDHKSVQS